MRTSILIGLLVAISVVLLSLPFIQKTGNEETPVACTMEAKLCPDGSAVGRTGPNCEFSPCPISPTPETDELIIIDAPLPGETVTSPITVRGKARGNWFFEASFPIIVVNWDGLIIGQGIATAQGEWMTTEFVPFIGSISYTFDPQTPYNRGAIIFKKDNPSGLPAYDDAREIPVLFGKSDAGMEYPIPDGSNIRPVLPPGNVVCTMDAKRCPDGSFVGRQAPNCEFAPCPNATE